MSRRKLSSSGWALRFGGASIMGMSFRGEADEAYHRIVRTRTGLSSLVYRMRVGRTEHT